MRSAAECRILADLYKVGATTSVLLDLFAVDRFGSTKLEIKLPKSRTNTFRSIRNKPPETFHILFDRFDGQESIFLPFLRRHPAFAFWLQVLASLEGPCETAHLLYWGESKQPNILRPASSPGLVFNSTRYLGAQVLDGSEINISLFLLLISKASPQDHVYGPREAKPHCSLGGERL